MKRLIFYGITALAVLTSCDNKAKEDAANAQALAESTREELIQAINERDQLLQLFSEVAATTDSIKSVENIVSIGGINGETATSPAQINNDLKAIKATLADRKAKLAELEKALKNSKASNSKLLATVEELKATIANQSSTIDDLAAKLLAANDQIAALDSRVNDLSSEVSQVTTQRDSVQQEANRQEELANECFYAIGSKDELKKEGIIEGGGFLKKSKILQGEFNKNFFIKADKRTLNSIPLHSKKAKVITTSQPAGSYDIIDNNGQKVLIILKPDEFWGTSNFLVVQID